MRVKVDMNEKEAGKYFDKTKPLLKRVNINLDTEQKRWILTCLIVAVFILGTAYIVYNYSGHFISARQYNNCRNALSNCNDAIEYQEVKDISMIDSLKNAVKQQADSLVLMLGVAILLGWILHGVGFKIIGT